MVCSDCIAKLAMRLVQNHTRLDLILAFELAEKALDRTEKRLSTEKLTEKQKIRTVTNEEEKALGFDPDYSQDCIAGGTCICYCDMAEGLCYIQANLCSCSCPDPLPNSSYVSDTCYPAAMCGSCPRCPCTCTCTGLCYYDCDENYEWDPILEECVLVAKHPLGDGIVFTV